MKNIRIILLAATVFALLSATIVQPELQIKSILNDKVEIKLPKEFQIMSEEMVSLKYPSERRPTLTHIAAKYL